MSELINNRQELLKALIAELHLGLDITEAKTKFKTDFGSISTEEIVELEEGLIKSGMPITEVQRLCDVHAALFEGSIEDIHKPKSVIEIPGHPANVLHEENNQLLKLIEDEIVSNIDIYNPSKYLLLRIGFERLFEISNHYARKEYLIFPYLEKKGIESIPKVMWGVDNDIRSHIKNVINQLNDKDALPDKIQNEIQLTISMIKDMVTKEENILLPKLVETLSYYEWIMIDKGSDEIGYFLNKPKIKWSKQETIEEVKTNKIISIDAVEFDAGVLSQLEINQIFNTLPLDMTFVDKDGVVKYFTRGKERIFDRPLSIIGRHVSMCHPPKSVHIVEEIIESFRSGIKDHEDFYIQMKDSFIYIRYFAIRSSKGDFLGTLEVTQNILPIRELQGEKRLIEK